MVVLGKVIFFDFAVVFSSAAPLQSIALCSHPESPTGNASHHCWTSLASPLQSLPLRHLAHALPAKQKSCCFRPPSPPSSLSWAAFKLTNYLPLFLHTNQVALATFKFPSSSKETKGKWEEGRKRKFKGLAKSKKLNPFWVRGAMQLQTWIVLPDVPFLKRGDNFKEFLIPEE